MNKRKILLVEDDNNLGTILKEFLTVKEFLVTHCLNGEEGIKSFSAGEFHLCILDVMMPKLDGFSLAKKIRSSSEVPIIFLTAKSMLDDKLEGFKLGADDYITKPFSMEELLLRISSILKRTNKQNFTVNVSEYKIGKFIFIYDKRILKHGKHEQKLTSKEAELLKLLCENKNNLLERSNALVKIWKEESYFTSRSMDVYITKLRNYLREDEQIEIVNVHGNGFKLISE